MMKKRIAKLMAVILTLSFVAGCGNETNTESVSIELVEPVGVTENYAIAERRDLVSYNVLSGRVIPKIEETSFPTDQNFEEYGCLPGTEVKKGDALAIASTETIDEKIKAKNEQIDNALDNLSETLEDLNESLSGKKANLENYERIVQNFENMTEEEKKKYPNYESEYRKYLGEYQGTVASIERFEQQIKEQTEMTNLDVDYYRKELARLNKDRNNILATSPIDGTVVAVNFFRNGPWTSKDTVVGAVGDFTKLRVVTEFVYKNDIKRAKEYYAVCNGKKYNAFYLEDESEIKSSTADSTSSFALEDPNGEVKAGDFVVIVIIKDTRDDVLCVPTESVNSDTDGSYVYKSENEMTERINVTTGLKCGLYTEITSGLSEGDKIVSEFKVEAKKNRQTLSKGKISSSFEQTGFLFYTKYDYVETPVEYGTTYIKEILVKNNERVTKGQTLATVWVVPDDIAIRRKERTMLRANEDLADLIKDGEEANKKAIKQKREYIADLQKEIDEMKADSSLTALVAPFDGIITDSKEMKEGSIAQKGQWVFEIAKEENCFVFCEDTNGLLTYGNSASVVYTDATKQNQTADGMVVTAAPIALSDDLRSGFALIRVPSEDLTKMAMTNMGSDGWWMRSHFQVKVETRTMDNVILVPKRAVVLEGGIPYVTVMEDNKPVYKSFVAGGSDAANYWVIDGLTEGTEICLE